MRRGLWTLMLLVTAGSMIALSATMSQAASRPRHADVDVWRHIPVYHNGRIMPLDTFARTSTDIVCGRTDPTIAPPADGVDKPLNDSWQVLFPDGKPHKWKAAELLLSWLVEPERWEDVPFLPAKHEELRRDVLDVPLTDKNGEFVAGVSPRTVSESAGLQQKIMDIVRARREAADKGEQYRLSAVEKKVEQLAQAYQLYRQLTFNNWVGSAAQRGLGPELGKVAQTWMDIDTQLKESEIGSVLGSTLLNSATASLRELYTSFDTGPQAVVAKNLDALKQATAQVHEGVKQLADRLASEPPDTLKEEQLAKLRELVGKLEPATQALAEESANMVDSAAHLFAGQLFTDENGLCVIPALNPAALEADRDTAEGPSPPPWLGLQAVLQAPLSALTDYPQQEIKDVRTAFTKLSDRFDHRYSEAGAFASAQREFAESLRNLGTAVEPARQKLDVHDRDEAMMAYTAYPPVGATDPEVRYNTISPFLWSWVIGFLALVAYSLSFGRIKTAMYWVGSTLLLAALAWTAYGFYLRIVISGWAPVTNMYETVIFVPFVVGVLGFCFALAPMLGPAWRNAWRLSAVPGTWEATELGEDHLRLMSASAWSRANVVMLLPRLALSVFVLLLLAVWPYAAGGRTIINLLPNTDVGASMPNMNDFMVWIVGLMVLLPTVWYLPRAILSAVTFPLAVPLTVHGRYTALWPQVLRRRSFSIAATAVATTCWIIAWYAPAVLDPNFRPLMPVLRDNFWLLIHVLTIVSSYGAGALAWGMGNIALAYYLFGRYRQPALATGVDATLRGTPAMAFSHTNGDNRPKAAAPQALRAPEACAALAGYTYKAIQVAVVLLAAGTILGALWADVAWGRFWGWDPKEVWALISLLVYVAILHGRFAGITGNFGLVVGSVMGATAILMSWYGVNFVLGAGLHSYGFSDSAQGQWYVLGGILLDWLFVLAAAIRYFGAMKTSAVAAAHDSAPETTTVAKSKAVETSDSHQESEEALTR